MSENARTVLEKRYLRRDSDGQPVETPHEMFWRVARFVAAAETELKGEPAQQADVFYDLMTEMRFLQAPIARAAKRRPERKAPLPAYSLPGSVDIKDQGLRRALSRLGAGTKARLTRG